ncbi:MAG: Tm-1-like ATP-binding domain-containing protein, partial [Rhodospirillales bacterium]|nr:Tm-1-like ATP-binding domain-containing protein [Rhodospirillales bacterium]
RKTQDIDGNEIGTWLQPETDQHFTDAIKAKLTHGVVKELDMQINDEAFADACVEEFLELMKR